MKNVWIFITFGFLLISAVRPLPTDDKQLDNVDDVDGYLGEEADRDGAEDGDEEDSGPPPILRSQDETFYVREGDSLRLPCKIENSDSGVVMWWLENTILWSDKIVMMAAEHSNFKLSEDHSLMISDLKREDSGKFKCVVAHGGKQQSVSYEVHVSIPPKVLKIVPDGPKKTVEKGSPLTLMCEAVGDPTPSISWTKKTKHGEEKLEGSKISIDMVNRKHSGVYECKASNNKGEFDTKSVDIHVLYAPEVEVENDIVYNGEGYETILICIVHGEPKAKVHWLKEEQPLSFAHHHITVADKGNKHSLIIAGTTKADFGVYKCVAENTKGSSSKIITLSGKPTKPKFHAAEESVDIKSPVLSWKINSFAPILSYELLYRLQDKGEWKSVDVGVEAPSTTQSNEFIARHTLAGLEPGTYQAQLRAKNEFGWSELSDPHTFSGSVLTAVNELSETSLLESSNNNPNAASELRISFALVISLLVARYYC